MPGAVYQLNVKGKQNVYLTGNPEFNFIKQIYKRHTNFAIQQTELLFKTDVNFGKTIEINIPRNGDFLYKMYFKFTLPKLTITSGSYAGWTNSIGHAIIDYVELYIGGHCIDKHYGLFLEIWNDLTSNVSVNSNINNLIGKVEHPYLLQTNALSENTYIVPLQYWFCNNIGSALPILNLMYHPIQLKIKLNKFEDCIVYDGNTLPIVVDIKNSCILSEYIYIDDSEKLKYINSEQKYIINQVQSIYGESISNGTKYKTSLDFNHPCSELLFVLRETQNEDNNDWFNFSKRNLSPFTPVLPLIKSAKLTLDGIDRIDLQDEVTLRLLNSSRYHTNTPNKHIYTIPLCNEPEKWYPTGTLNFSLIDSPILHIDLQNNIDISKIFIFAKNFNFVSIQNGLFKLGFSS